jgi:hypothetical protein
LLWGPAPDRLEEETFLPLAVTEHEVEIAGLEPESRYYYAVGDGEGILAGGDGHFFRTPPRPGEARPTRIWVIGDAGTANVNSAAVRDSFLAWNRGEPPDVWLMLGDNAYDHGTDAQYQAAVFGTFAPLLRRAVPWPTLGNHDAISSHAPTETGPYFDAFTLPTGGEAGGVPSGTEAYYSFDRGDLHFVALDTSKSDRSEFGPMMQWLRADLHATERRWIVVFMHVPPYTRGSHDSDHERRSIELREIALPILEAAGVDLVLGGHSHSYERSFLLAGHYGPSASLGPEMILDPGDGRPDGDGPYRKRPGPRGGTLYVVMGSSGIAGGGPLDHPVMRVGINRRGSLVLDVDGDRLEGTFLSMGGEVLDRFALVKDDG